MNTQLIQIAKTVSMMNSTRFVNIRGYIREVVVSRKHKNGEWIVKDGQRLESVPEHLFYHSTNSGLQLRDSVEFKRLYSSHPVEVDKLPEL